MRNCSISLINRVSRKTKSITWKVTRLLAQKGEENAHFYWFFCCYCFRLFAKHVSTKKTQLKLERKVNDTDEYSPEIMEFSKTHHLASFLSRDFFLLIITKKFEDCRRHELIMIPSWNAFLILCNSWYFSWRKSGFLKLTEWKVRFRNPALYAIC